MEVTAPKSKHVRIPPPNVATNGIKSNTSSPQKPAGRQSRPQSASRGPGAPVRYFVIKSINRENVERSIDQGVWSTQVGFLTYACSSSTFQPCHGCAVCGTQRRCCCVCLNFAAPLQRHNEQKLREAFERSKDVFLIFSVNMSGHFQGYARMISVGNQNQVCFSCKPKLPSRLPYASKQFGLGCFMPAQMQLYVLLARMHTSCCMCTTNCSAGMSSHLSVTAMPACCAASQLHCFSITT